MEKTRKQERQSQRKTTKVAIVACCEHPDKKQRKVLESLIYEMLITEERGHSDEGETSTNEANQYKALSIDMCIRKIMFVRGSQWLRAWGATDAGPISVRVWSS